MPAQTDGTILTPGTTLSIQTAASPETYALINGVQDISGVGHDRPTVRRTELQDTEERYHAGRKEGTQVTIPMYYVRHDLGQDTCRDHLDSSDPATFKVTYPDSGTRVFTAIVLSMPESTPDNEHVTVTMTLKITSDITFVVPT